MYVSTAWLECKYTDVHVLKTRYLDSYADNVNNQYNNKRWYLEIGRNQCVLFYFTIVLLVCTIVLFNRTYSYGQPFALTC
jgi:hypothetical protein